VIKPQIAIVQGLRDRGVTVPVIGFPRGAGALVETYASVVPVQGVALDTQVSAVMGQRIQKIKPIQGALDPLLLRAGGDQLLRRVDQMIEQWGQGPYIFNLGHGILPDTPIAHVEQVLARVTGK
jgi:uroporphyrinogen decarboxylase